MDTVWHSGSTIVRHDPFDAERLVRERQKALLRLRCASYVKQPWLWEADVWYWRGIGAIRFQTNTDTRALQEHLHIWHRTLMLPGIEEAGNIHEHPFDLVSDVLVGTLQHTWFAASNHVSTVGQGLLFDVYDSTKSITDKIETARYSKASVGLAAPCSYAFKREQFHSSVVTSEIAITRCVKTNITRQPQRMLAPAGSKPVASTAFVPLAEQVFKRVIDQAVAALEDVL